MTLSERNNSTRPLTVEESSSDSRIETLYTWFAKNGGKLHESVRVALTPSHGYQLRVRHDQKISRDSLIVACPHHLTISVMDLEWAKDPWPAVFKSHWKHHPEVLTRFFIMEQYLEKEESFWWPYIALLPQPDQEDQMNTPMWYHELDLIWIKGTNLDGSRISRSSAWRRQYEESISLLKQHDSKRGAKIHMYDW